MNYLIEEIQAVLYARSTLTSVFSANSRKVMNQPGTFTPQGRFAVIQMLDLIQMGKTDALPHLLLAV